MAAPVEAPISRFRLLPWLGTGTPRALRWAVGLVLVLPLAWAGLLIGAGPPPLPGHWVPACIYAGIAGWSLWHARRAWPLLACLAVAAVVLVAWWGIRPSNERPWRPEVAVMPRIHLDGDRVRITGYRNFRYRSREDFDERWEQRELRLSDLRGVDFFVSYWQPDGIIAHTFLSFQVAGADPVAISIEIRPEQGESFDALPGLLRHFELVYVVGDERDLVGVRSNHRDEEVFLYRTTASAGAARRLFLVYAARINAVAARPEFYNLLSNNCTVNIVRYANQAGRDAGWDVRHLLNGWSDRYLHDAGLVDTSIPFARLRALSRINEAARAADRDPAFSRLIRQGRPVPRALPAARAEARP
ncbi:Lnb N-terminal periplasmic domain-containing protein [Pseudoxanthomonas sp. 10H]|uniref:Lnb N-terminal periplasmic domain-containing protein n=1 Tax=Pseudoxanthomonas sp. 10H TaxID=3242729 RepID=UPI003557951B